MITGKTREQIEKLFYPQSIAVVGTNKVKGTVPADIFTNIVKDDFQGIIYPVAPGERFIAGIKSYKYVVDVPDEIDMAVLVFPSSVCHMALEQCGQKGIKSMIIISAGFKEVGQAGLEREKQIKAIADKYGISFIGPNCLGVINTDPVCRMNASFARMMPEEGNIAFISQSGALCTAVLDYARSKHIGFSKFVSIGNKADVNEIDLLNYLKDDPKTKVILLYLEEVSNAHALMDISREIITETGKPILAIKSGRTIEGASAAASHTGSLAGVDATCDAAFSQAGIIRCENIEDMFNYAIAFAYQPIPKGNRIAIITNAGGPGVLTTDMAIREGLSLSRFTEETTKLFKSTLPKTANIKNPVDVIGDAKADRYNIAITAALKDPNVDGVMIILTPQSMTDIKTIAEEITHISGQYEKPIFTSFMGAVDVAVGIEILEKHRIPHYSLPENMCKAFARAHRFKKLLEKVHIPPAEYNGVDKEFVKTIIDDALKAGRKFLPEAEAVQILRAYNFPVLPSGLAQTCEEAIEIATKIGFPVVMKIVSDDIVHKFDIGGVRLNIISGEDAGNAFRFIMENVKHSVPNARIKGIYVQKMIRNGEEVILGVKKDNLFGPVIMFGLGGIFVEVFKDVSFRIAPVFKDSITDMIHETKSYPILAGARGRIGKDIIAIEECIQKLSQLSIDFPQINELDINPLIVLDKGNGCYVADTKIMLENCNGEQYG